MLENSSTQHNYGIDALRMLSMYFVAVLHVLLKSNLINQPVLSDSYEAAWLLETAAYCAVDVFALISGYVGIKAKYKYTNLIMLWLRVFFYSILITIGFLIFSPDLVGVNEQLNAFFPVFRSQYWYVSAYVCLFFLIPLLNKSMNTMNRQQARAMIIGLICVFSISQFLFTEAFRTIGGYSGLWLMIVYLIGAYIGKYDDSINIQPLLAGIGYLICTMAAFLLKHVRNVFLYRILEIETQPYLYAKDFKPVSYVSPLILFAAIFLLLLFRQLRFEKSRPIIAFFSPLAFSVYLIHAHPLIWDNLLPVWFAPLSAFPVPLMLPSVLLLAAVLYLCCSLIDVIRETLFRVLKIKRRIAKLENRFVGDLWNA